MFKLLRAKRNGGKKNSDRSFCKLPEIYHLKIKRANLCEKTLILAMLKNCTDLVLLGDKLYLYRKMNIYLNYFSCLTLKLKKMYGKILYIYSVFQD